MAEKKRFFFLQQFEQQGLRIVNKANGYCLSAGPQSCGKWSNCNKGLAQTRQNNTILNVFAEACDANKPSQQWTLGPAPNSTLIDFTPLNVSAARYPQPIDTLAAQASNNSKQVRLPFVACYLELCESTEATCPQICCIACHI